jgi:hypothetical protein
MPNGTRRHSSLSTSALWFTAGAAAGIVVGVVLADRFGGGRKLLNRVGGLLGSLDKWAVRHPSDEDDENDDDDFDGEADVDLGEDDHWQDAEYTARDEYDVAESDDTNDVDDIDDGDEAFDDGDEADDDDDDGDGDGDDDDDGDDGDDGDDAADHDDDVVAASTAPRIDERVLAAFQQDPVLSQRSIEIDEPEPATIVLAGRVLTASDATHAVTIARGVPGVAHVENYLRVRRTRPRPTPRTTPNA